MNKPSNTALTAGDFDDDGTDEFVLPTKIVEKPLLEAPQDDLPVSVTKPQDALDRKTQVPPQLVEEVQNNVELLRPVARSMAAINLHNLFMKIQHPNTPARDRLEMQKMLNEMAGLELKGAAVQQSGGGFSITINLPQVGEVKGNVIEAKAEKIISADPE